MTKTKTKKGLEDRLGVVLGRSWVVLGAVLGQLGPHFRAVAAVALVFLKIDVFEKMRCQKVTWDDLGSIWGAKRLQNEGRGGSKSEMR